MAFESTNTMPTKKPATIDRYEKIHEEAFKKMENIKDWAERRGKTTAAIGQKRKSSVLDDGRDQAPVSRVKPKVSIHDREAGGDDRRMSKRPRVMLEKDSTSSTSVNTKEEEEQKQKEREAIRRQLNKNKAKRRSSMGTNVPRSSPTKNPTIKPKSRFGFLSSAKSIVQTVWNRNGKSTAKPSTPTSKAQSSTLQPKAHPTTTTSIKAKPTIGFMGPPPPKPGNVPTASRIPSTSSDKALMRLASPPQATVALPSVPSEEGSAGTPKDVNSIGSAERKRNTASLGHKSVPRVPSTSSRLLAPTASSLAKMHNAPSEAVGSMSKRSTSVTRNIGSLKASPAPGSIGNAKFPDVMSSRPTIFSQPLPSPVRRSVPASMSSPIQQQPKPAEGASTNHVAGTLASPSKAIARRPRISRSKVIAKLASQRVAGPTTVGDRSSVGGGKTRSSLGLAAAGGKRSSHGVIGQSDAMISPKKRVRQSEFNRRKSKAAADAA